jgi:release factor glutamine methyltransferase
MPLEVDPYIELRRAFYSRLAGRYAQSEIQAIWTSWLRKRAGLTPVQRLMQTAGTLPTGLAEQAEWDLTALVEGKPLQYVLNEAWFMGRPFVLNGHVLIPRPETEELVQWMLEEQGSEARKVVDLGCGSGVIPISLKLARPHWELFAVELSAEALATAVENAALHGVKLSWISGDMLEVELPDWDILVSNPPYISRDEMAEMREEVLSYEPHMALFAPGSDALLFYRRMAQLADAAPSGRFLYLELNHEKAPEIQGLFHRHQTILHTDMQGKLRMMRVITQAI